MNKKLLAALIVIVLAICGIGAYALFHKNNDTTSMTGMDMSPNTTKTASLVQKNSAVYKQYDALTGAAYDKTFLANMIVHHQGAVAMAQLALTNAKHQELKDMANSIISAQSGEISEMQQWQQDWGYPSSSGDDMQDHSAMGMMNDMAGMEDDLKGETGDAFDKAFLSQMIMHHQSAINMAAPGETNAQHQQVKDLTPAIVTAQSSEIKQMQQWQKDWNY